MQRKQLTAMLQDEMNQRPQAGKARKAVFIVSLDTGSCSQTLEYLAMAPSRRNRPIQPHSSMLPSIF